MEKETIVVVVLAMLGILSASYLAWFIYKCTDGFNKKH